MPGRATENMAVRSFITLKIWTIGQVFAIAGLAQNATKTMADEFTLVELSRSTHARQSLIFGAPQKIIKRPKTVNLGVFNAGQILGYERWRANDFGTISRLFYVLICGPERAVSRVPGVHPGADIVFRARGNLATLRALAWIKSFKKHPELSPEQLQERHWRRLGQLRYLRQKYPNPNEFWESCRHD